MNTRRGSLGDCISFSSGWEGSALLAALDGSLVTRLGCEHWEHCESLQGGMFLHRWQAVAQRMVCSKVLWDKDEAVIG
jgi:hypothetical protein